MPQNTKGKMIIPINTLVKKDVVFFFIDVSIVLI
jgi:hypothetical protein